MTSWHKQRFDKTLKDLKMSLINFPDFVTTSGFLAFFEKGYFDMYKKYSEVEQEYNSLWGKMDEASMEKFKNLLGQWLDCTKWVIGKYIEKQCAAKTQDSARLKKLKKG